MGSYEGASGYDEMQVACARFDLFPYSSSKYHWTGLISGYLPYPWVRRVPFFEIEFWEEEILFYFSGFRGFYLNKMISFSALSVNGEGAFLKISFVFSVVFSRILFI